MPKSSWCELELLGCETRHVGDCCTEFPDLKLKGFSLANLHRP